MQLFCRQCGAEIQAENVNLDTMMAKCSVCNAVFSFQDMYDDIKPKKEKAQAPGFAYSAVPMPANMSLNETDTTLTITRSWRSLTTAFLLIFAVIWNGMLWTIFVPTFTGISFEINRGPSFPFGLFILPFIGAGFYLIYRVAAELLNTTTITVTDHHLRITHAPIPARNSDLSADMIEQLYARVHVSRSSNGNTSRTYSLNVLLRDGSKKKLIGGLSNEDQALYIEQEIERFLGIENIPVRGAVA